MSHFNYTTITLTSGQQWAIASAKLDCNSELYKRAVMQATQKAQFTMAASQAGAPRSPAEKLQKQLMGILAEIYTQEYLKEIIAAANLSLQWQVIRYDDVRTDGFKSAANEYDIQLKPVSVTGGYTVESRSSIAHDRSLKTAVEQFDIIGPYTSVAKPGEGWADFFIRPLYEFSHYANGRYVECSFANYLRAGAVKLHIVAGCTKQDMITRGYYKSMKQAGTHYRVIKIVGGYDVNKFIPILIEKLM